MKYIDYMRLNPFQRFWYKFSTAMKAFPGKFVAFFVAIGKLFVNFFVKFGKGVADYCTRFVKGDWATKISYLFMGFGNITKGQVVKGLLFFLIEVGYIAYMVFFGWSQLMLFGTLGTIERGSSKVLNPATGFYEYPEVTHDSRQILLYGILTILLTIVFIVIYLANTKSAYSAFQKKAAGEKLPTIQEEVKDLFDNKFHVTLLAFPTLTISIFTIIPLIFMILMAFTNYDAQHPAPGKLFTWVGLETFGEIFSMAQGDKAGYTFIELTKWTIIWAIFATILNYILGMIIALMINKKGIKLKALWRTLFVVTVAVPQFVTLLLMNQMLNYNDGAINILLCDILKLTPHYINFLGGEVLTAKITVIVVNCWVGIPYTILITSGILMNIPADLYESATIDGAGPVRSFVSITLPYMLFVTTPYLITNFIGNINNFNVIYLLTGGTGGPVTTEFYKGAGPVDLLVTWLYKLTVDVHDYNMAAAIGILVFIVCASLSLITFNLTKSANNEEEFS